MIAALERTVGELSERFVWARACGTSADRRRALAQLESARAELAELRGAS
jgi:hypothetical protein